MKILVILQSSDELLAYEGLSLAFLLASFDHHVSLQMHGKLVPLLQSQSGCIYGMLQAIALYDISHISVSCYADFATLDSAITALLHEETPDISAFDGVLSF